MSANAVLAKPAVPVETTPNAQPTPRFKSYFAARDELDAALDDGELELTGPQNAVLRYLIEHVVFDKKAGDWGWVTVNAAAVEVVARRTGLSPRTVKTVLADLAGQGLISRHHQPKLTGGRWPDRIRVDCLFEAEDDTPECVGSEGAGNALSEGAGDAPSYLYVEELEEEHHQADDEQGRTARENQDGDGDWSIGPEDRAWVTAQLSTPDREITVLDIDPPLWRLLERRNREAGTHALADLILFVADSCQRADNPPGYLYGILARDESFGRLLADAAKAAKDRADIETADRVRAEQETADRAEVARLREQAIGAGVPAGKVDAIISDNEGAPILAVSKLETLIEIRNAQAEFDRRRPELAGLVARYHNGNPDTDVEKNVRNELEEGHPQDPRKLLARLEQGIDWYTRQLAARAARAPLAERVLELVTAHPGEYYHYRDVAEALGTDPGETREAIYDLIDCYPKRLRDERRSGHRYYYPMED